MATQPVFPIGENYPADESITISSTFGASPGACQIGPETSVTFTNNSTSTINIMFLPNMQPGLPTPPPPVFNNIAALAPGATSAAQTSQNDSITVDYDVIVGNIVYGPYAIQVADGPLYIQMVLSNGEAQCTPGPATIPIGGSVVMSPGDSNSYNIGWKNNVDPFDPAITTADGNVHTEDVGTILTYTYTAKVPAPGGGTTSGGGTIHVSS